MTSATIARQYKSVLTYWANRTDKDNAGFVEFQGHDFSMRGMDSPLATISSGLGHAISFLGSDSLPVIGGARKYYNAEGFVVGSVNATEHSVMCAGSKDDEVGTFRRLMETFPTGILSVVSDTWDLWKVLTEYLPTLKDEILERYGKLVIRPDSGDPADIVCGDVHRVQGFNEAVLQKVGEGGLVYNYVDKKYYRVFTDHNGEVYGDIAVDSDITPNAKGVIELLWDIFGGTINSQGYKVLDPHIGAIYGDSITIDRAQNICSRLESKGFASTNIVLGVGSFTYQFNTRDTFGFAMKATYVEVDGVGQEIFKDPITDDGIKKSAKGLMCVIKTDGKYKLVDQVDWESESIGYLETIYNNGELYNQVSLSDVRQRLSK